MTAHGSPTARPNKRFPSVCWPAILLLATTAVANAAAEEAPAARPRPTVGVIIRFEGTITPLTEHYLYRKLELARGMRADLVVIEIDSPGGMLVPSLKIAEKLSETNWARTVAYVPREALSGGAIMALGCDEIVMGPQAKLGDAGPIYLSEGGLFEHAPEKLRSHLARHVHDLADSKGRPPALAEAMVDKDLQVYRCRNRSSGKEWYLSEHEILASLRPDEWEKLAPVLETLGGNFLEVNGQRAVELHLASATVGDREALRQYFELDSPWIVLEPSAKDLAVFVLNIPLVTGLLLVIGLVAFFVELSSPGIGLGGLVSMFCFSLFFWSRFLGGTSGWLEVVLFLVGAIFLGVEIFVLPGFGVAGVTGILLMIASVLMASQEFVIPHTHQELATFARGVVVLVGSIGVFLVTSAYLGRHLSSVPIFNRLVLAAPSEPTSVAGGEGKRWLDPQGKPLVGGESTHGAAVQVGDWGMAQTPLRPAGKARFGPDLLDVVADGAFIDAGRQVRVTEAQGSRVVVAQVPDAPDQARV